MTIPFEDIVDHVLQEGKVSRAEKKALENMIEELGQDKKSIEKMVQIVVDAAKKGSAPQMKKTIDGLAEILKITLSEKNHPADMLSLAAVYFSPGEDCVNAVISLLRAAVSTIDICVFTITDDQISREIRKAYTRGIKIRIITDDEKSEDLGSDITELKNLGIPVMIDNGPSHMHHKFCIFDKKVVVTGSYNWTRSASRDNQENIVVSNDKRLVQPFQQEFEKLYRSLRRKQ